MNRLEQNPPEANYKLPKAHKELTRNQSETRNSGGFCLNSLWIRGVLIGSWWVLIGSSSFTFYKKTMNKVNISQIIVISLLGT